MIPARIRDFVFDIDGCLAVGSEPIPGALEALQELRRRGHRFVLFTNDSLRSSEEWGERVRGMGFAFPDLRVITAGELLAQLVSDRFPGGRAFVVGTESVAGQLSRRGIEVVGPGRAREADVVVVARDPGFDYATMTAALRALLAGAALFTASMARTIPAPDGPVPGTGATTAALAFAADVEPVVAGKPSALAARLCLEIAGFERGSTAFVGDDPELDVATARMAEAFSILVLTGTAGPGTVERLPAEVRPDAVLPSVAELPAALDGGKA
jgi:HAD superfamily hydrolase (TIGR01450 family)